MPIYHYENCCKKKEVSEGIIEVTGNCIQCGKKITVQFPKIELENYYKGELVQRAFKSLSANEREFLMSGICPEDWDKMFKFE